MDNLILSRLLIALIRFYQRHVPARIRACCRFEPTCSEYMILAVTRHGFAKGLAKGVGRICRCRPPYGGADSP